jgi:hypothetical protein
MQNLPRSIQDIENRSKLVTYQAIKGPLRYVLTIECTQGFEESISFDEDNKHQMQDLLTILFLLSEMFRQQRSTDERGAVLTEQQKFLDCYGLPKFQQQTIYEIGKDIFTLYNKNKPICCLFPMGGERVAKEFPKLLPRGPRDLQVLWNATEDEWPEEYGYWPTIIEYKVECWGEKVGECYACRHIFQESALQQVP